VSRARLPFLLLLALPLVACGKGAPPAPQPEPQATTASPEVKLAPPAELAPSATPTAQASADLSEKKAAIEKIDPPKPIAVEKAAPAKSPANAAAIAPIALPKAVSGVLAKGVADKILVSGGAAIVRLLEPGAEPRADLSYVIAKGPAPKLGMTMDMSMNMSSGAQKNAAKLPRMGMTLDGAAAEKNDAGEWKILAHLVGITVDGKDGGQAEQIAAAMRKQVEAMKGLGISYWLNPKGRVRDAKVELPKGFPASAQALVEGLNQSFESMVAPLPAEPVGLGAKWQVVSRMSASGVDLLQSATYTLTARDGEHATLDVAMTQLAASDTIKSPGNPGGAVAHVKSFISGGTGTTRINTSSVVPEGGVTTMKTSVKISVSQGAETSGESAVETLTRVELSRP